MKQSQDPALDVSPEEERFLRRAFRRFALPYLAAAAALGALAGWSAAVGGAAPEALRGDLEALRARVEALSEQLEAASAAQEADRGRLAALEARSSGDGGEAAVASLQGELRSVRNRMFDLEKRLERQPSPDRVSGVSDRVAGLARRLERVEADLAAVRPPAPAPAPAEPAPFAP